MKQMPRVLDFVMDSKDPQNLTPKEVKEWWENQQANNYFTDKVFSFSRPELIQKFNLNKDSKILELGPGYGRETSQFLKITDNVCGLEISKTAAERLQKEFPKAEFKEFDGVNLPYPDDSFDLIYSCFVLQHMSKESAKKVLIESIRVLKKGGCFLHEFLSEPYCADKGNEHYSGGLSGMYNNGYTQDELLDLVKELDLNLVFLQEYECHESRGPVYNLWLSCRK